MDKDEDPNRARRGVWIFSHVTFYVRIIFYQCMDNLDVELGHTHSKHML